VIARIWLVPCPDRTLRQSLYHLGSDVTADGLLSALERESAATRGGHYCNRAQDGEVSARSRIRLTQFSQSHTLI